MTDHDFKNMDQPSDCLFGGGSCCYPVVDCENCPARPENGDPYLGMTSASVE